MVSPRPVPPADAPDLVWVKASKISADLLGLDPHAGVAHLEQQAVVAGLAR